MHASQWPNYPYPGKGTVDVPAKACDRCSLPQRFSMNKEGSKSAPKLHISSFRKKANLGQNGEGLMFSGGAHDLHARGFMFNLRQGWECPCLKSWGSVDSSEVNGSMVCLWISYLSTFLNQWKTLSLHLLHALLPWQLPRSIWWHIKVSCCVTPHLFLSTEHDISGQAALWNAMFVRKYRLLFLHYDTVVLSIPKYWESS